MPTYSVDKFEGRLREGKRREEGARVAPQIGGLNPPV